MKDLLTAEDYNFGLKIVKEYREAPLNDLHALFLGLRRQIEYAESANRELKTIRQTDISELKTKLSPGTIVHNIVVNTNKGPVTIYNYGDVYKNIFTTLRKIVSKYKIEAERDKQLNKYLSAETPFRLIVRSIKKTPLGPDQKRIVIGMILVYFNLYGIKTESEFKKSQIIGWYKEYLSDRVQSKLKTLRLTI